MRVSLVGFGRMGVRLCEAAERAGLEVAAVLDEAETPFGLGARPDLSDRLHRDPERFWAVPSDVLAIGTTAPSHLALVERGLAAGFRRIVVEKPFACSVAEAERAIAAAEAVGARLLVDHSRRYCPNYIKVAEGAPELAHLGRLRTVATVVGGGGLGCLGVHFFDLCNMLFGAMPDSVTAHMTAAADPNPRGPQFDDPGGAVLLTYPGGGRGFLDFSDDIGVYAGMTLSFEEGVLLHENEFIPWRMRARRSEDRGKRFSLNALPLTEESFPDWTDFSGMERWAALFKDAAADGPPVSGAGLGLESMRVYAAARWSGRLGGAPVRFPLPPEAEAAVYPIP